jgi:ABC-type nitrate/sulfonate/bicarbonate transport system substrate-binding protein
MVDYPDSVSSGSQLTSLYLTRRPVPTALALAAGSGILGAELPKIRLNVHRLDPDEPTPQGNALRELDGFAAIHAGAGGTHARVVVGVTWIREFQALVTLPGSRIRSVRDLRNRRIALPVSPNARAHAHRVASLAVELGGLQYREVEWVNLKSAPANAEDGASDAMLPGCPVEYALAIAALAAGKVDVVHVQGLRGLQAMRSCGAHPIFSATDYADRRVKAHVATPMALIVDRDAEGREPAQMTGLLDCARAIGVWARSHSREVARSLSQQLGVPESDIFSAFGAKFYEHLIPDLVGSSRAAIESLQSFLDRWSFSAEHRGTLTPQAAVARALERDW